MPRTGYFIAVMTAIISAVVFPWPAGADHVQGEEPYFTCRASVVRATLFEGNPIPTIEPLAANANREECAEGTAGAPTLALPPGEASPAVSAGAVQASTEILCADDDPDPTVTPPNNDDCDAGRRSFEQQVLSRADAADVDINAGDVRVQIEAANTTARARCGPGNVPVLSSTSNVANIVVTLGTADPIQIQLPPPNEEMDIDLGLVRLVLNEEIVTPATQQPNAQGDYVYPDAAPNGQVIRRAVHVQIPGGTDDTAGDTADVVVAESIADFHGDVCPEGRIEIRKQTAPGENPPTTNFSFSAGGGLTPATFILQDDGTQVFEEVQPGQSYTVTEAAPPSPFSLAEIDCRDRDGDTATSLPTRTATIAVGPGETVSCTFTNVRPGPPPPGQVTCPDGTTNVGGRCVVSQTECPPGATRNAQGQCIVTNVQCPPGTTFNPVTRGCSEAPRGGTLFPIIPRIAELFRASPCIGQGFGPLLGIFGTNGPDRITGTNISDRIFALAGNDRVSGGRGDDCVEGGGGNDVLDGSNGNDFLLGGTGNDRVTGGPGRDRFSGGSGRDVMSGGIGNDRMTGGSGRDRLQGGYGNDRLVGGSGNDGIHTGNGRDRVRAGSGNDIINAATVGPPAFVDCGPGRKDRVRINRNERRRVRNCEFVDVPRRIRSNNRPISPR